MPFFTATQEEVERVKQAKQTRDLSVLKSAKERCIYLFYCSPTDADRQEIAKLGRNGQPDIVKQAEEIFGVSSSQAQMAFDPSLNS